MRILYAVNVECLDLGDLLFELGLVGGCARWKSRDKDSEPGMRARELRHGGQ